MVVAIFQNENDDQSTIIAKLENGQMLHWCESGVAINLLPHVERVDHNIFTNLTKTELGNQP